jgi:hypothetical protein
MEMALRNPDAAKAVLVSKADGFLEQAVAVAVSRLLRACEKHNAKFHNALLLCCVVLKECYSSGMMPIDLPAVKAG